MRATAGPAGFALHRFSAIVLNNVDGVPGQSGVVHNSFAGIAGQESLGQQVDDIVALYEIAGLVIEKTPVEIAIPCNPEICLVFLYRINRWLPILRKQGIRDTVWEVSVRLVVNLDELKWQERFKSIDDGTGATIARIHHNF